jgi:hypothetical protein
MELISKYNDNNKMVMLLNSTTRTLHINGQTVRPNYSIMVTARIVNAYIAMLPMDLLKGIYISEVEGSCSNANNN